jgi:Rad3-related DNA helicase
MDRLQNSLIRALGFGDSFDATQRHLSEVIKQIKVNERIGDAFQSGAIIPLKETGIYDLFKIMLNAKEFFNEIDEESYLFDVEETARMFDGFFDETYVTVDKKENSLIFSLVTTNLEKKFKNMSDKNKIIVLMSGTLHSNQVLKTIFGLEEFKIIEAEIESQGKIEVLRTGLEIDCKYSNFYSGKFSREQYLKALSKCLNDAKKPVLVHINAFNDLPTKDELQNFNIDNLISREKLKELQQEDKTGNLIEEFKSGEMDVLFSTRASRGMDFPGEQCNSIVFTKYPNPNVKDAFWKILNKTRPQHYWDFYRDKARRELWQKVYRGLRFKDDHVYVLSPDTRVLDAFENNK